MVNTFTRTGPCFSWHPTLILTHTHAHARAPTGVPCPQRTVMRTGAAPSPARPGPDPARVPSSTRAGRLLKEEKGSERENSLADPGPVRGPLFGPLGRRPSSSVAADVHWRHAPAFPQGLHAQPLDPACAVGERDGNEWPGRECRRRDKNSLTASTFKPTTPKSARFL